MNDSLLAAAVSLVRNYPGSDLMEVLHGIGDTLFNGGKILTDHPWKHGGREGSIEAISASLLEALVRQADHPAVRKRLASISKIDGRDLRTVLSARWYLKRNPGVVKVLKNLLLGEVDYSRFAEVHPMPTDEEYEGSVLFPAFRDFSATLEENVERYGTALDFWGLRVIDSTADLMEKLLAKAAYLSDSAWVAAEQAPPENRQPAPFPVFFEPRSFIDPEGSVRSILDCRDRIVERYLDALDSSYRAGVEVTVNDPRLPTNLVSYRSAFFNPGLVYFALTVDEAGRGSWQRTGVEPALVIRAQDGCEEIDLHVNVTIVNVNQTPASLFAALPAKEFVDKGRTPSGYYPLKATSGDSVPEPGKVAIAEGGDVLVSGRTMRFFPVPECERRVRNLIRIDRYGIVGGGTHAIESVLSAVMDSGDTVEVMKDTAWYDYVGESWFNASLGDPLMLDANGDGLLDIVVEASRERRMLLLQLDNGGFERRALRGGEYIRPC